MKVSYHPLFGNPTLIPDDEMVGNDLRLLDLAEPLGFDSIMCVEHHFDREYSIMPDNFQLLAYMAGRTESIELGLSAIILPWHNPLRVTEQISLLDHLSGGRLMVGFGRGLSKLEYDGYGIEMGESRERFDEAAAMILRGLRTGVVENDGPFYPQSRVEIRPAPARSFHERLYCVGMSPDSCSAAGAMGGGLLCFTQWPIEQHMPMITTYEAYDASAEAIRAAGLDAATQAWADAQIFGSPEQIIERYRARLAVSGPIRSGVIFNFGGMPIKEAEASMRLDAEEVLPVLQQLDVEAAVSAYCSRAPAIVQ